MATSTIGNLTKRKTSAVHILVLKKQHCVTAYEMDGDDMRMCSTHRPELEGGLDLLLS